MFILSPNNNQLNIMKTYPCLTIAVTNSYVNKKLNKN